MTSDCIDALWPDEHRRLRPADLADLAGVSEAEVLELVECGALTPAEGTPGQWVFGVRSITVARTARRLREDLELDPHGVALLLAFIDRIRGLEDELRDLRARLPEARIGSG
jgi:chaperone modulatory protein CbpM